MVFTSLLFVLPWLLHGASSLPNRPSRTEARELQAPAAPAMPTVTLISDFKKNNVSAKWAEGYPKVWGAEEKTYEMPVPLGQAVFDASLSPDQKFLVLSNSTDMRVINLATGDIVSTPGHNATGDNGLVELLSAPGGEYDLVVSARYNNELNRKLEVTTQIRLSTEGSPIGRPIEFKGTLIPKDAAGHFSKDGRRMLTLLGAVANVYSLDDATYNLTLSGHTDVVNSAVFSPNGKYIATVSADGFTKIWDAQTGALLHDVDSWSYKHILTIFSPDSKFLLVVSGYGIATANLLAIDNVPVEVPGFGPFEDAIEQATWSPDGKYLAFSSISKLILVMRMSDLQIVQEWRANNYEDIEMLTWLEDGKKLAWRVAGGLEIYDFEKNLKYRWGPDDFDHYLASRKVFVLENKKWIGGVDGDQKVRFWPYPL